MARRRYNLPPLTTLSTFEAAARHLSFKHAADELNVTPGAVSHQVKALESEIGKPLFDRQHRSVQLTSAGERLYSVLNRGFSEFSETLAEIKNREQLGSVTIHATTAVSSLFLASKLARFWKEHGQIPVTQHVSDMPVRPDQVIDLSIQYGGIPSPQMVRAKLFDDVLIPVCSPALREENPSPTLLELSKMQLIHIEAESRNWTSWKTWFQDLGHTGAVETALKVNNYTIALQAAQDDAGVILGWKKLISPLLERGALVPLGDYQLDAPAVFHIVSHPPEMLTDNARTLRQWLLDNV